MTRRASMWDKRDSNEGPIIAALENLSVYVFKGGPLDFWARFPRESWFTPVEVKTKTGRLTKGQEEFCAYCLDAGLPVLVLRSTDEAIEAVQSRAVKHQEGP